MPLGYSIPGTIKNEYLPFRIEAGNSKTPQTFSFRNKSGISNFAQINICPSSLKNAAFGNYLEKDVSYQLLYDSSAVNTGSVEPILLNDIFNNIPAIQIREFLPDTKLDQCLNFFGNLISQLMMKSTGQKSIKELVKTASDNIEDLTSGNTKGGTFDVWKESAQEFINKAFKWITETLPTVGSAEAGSIGGSADANILNFPYLLYYKLQTCTTTNYYELPCVSEKYIISSDGSLGWNGMNEIGFGTHGGDGIIGKLFKFVTGSIFNNIRVNFMPYWDSPSGSVTKEDDISITFDLFNDTSDAATKNFIFVNTLVPGARWLQYGAFQHSPNLYDIKLEGVNRLFACTGTFSVKYGGQFRTPPNSLIWELTSKYGNDKMSGEKRIKIPDIYHVDLKFRSIIPKNFNTFLYSYSTTNNIENCLKTENTGLIGANTKNQSDSTGKNETEYDKLVKRINAAADDILKTE